MYSVKDVLDRQEELEALRRPEEAEWRSIARILRPDESHIGTDVPRPRAYDEIYDSSPLLAMDAFVGGMFGQATNPAVDWFTLGSDDEELNKWGPVAEHLWALKGAIQQSIQPAVSGFYAEVPAWFADTGAFGFGALYSEEDLQTGTYIDRVIPLAECYIGTDAHGRLNAFHRKFKLSGRQAKGWFGAIPNVDDRHELEFIHSVLPNPEHRPWERAVGPRGMAWCSTYVCRDRQQFRRAAYYSDLPYGGIRWNRRSGRVWPSGPGHIARADARMLNAMERSHIVAAQFAAEPMMATTSEDVLTVADLMPNNVIYGGVNEQGKLLSQPILRGQQLQLSMQQSEQRRAAIREALYFSLLQLAGRPQMTATEVLQFNEERLRLLGPNLVRIQTTGLSPFISRRYGMLARADRLPPAPPELANRRLEIKYVSPLAKALQMQEAKSTLQWLDGVSKLALVDQSAADLIDVDGAARVLHAALGPPPMVIRSQDAVDARREARAQAQQQQAALEQAGQAVTIAAEASHAQQAASLAEGRGRVQ